MSLFLGQLTRSASTRTLEETTLIEFDRLDFEDLLKRQPEMAFQLMKEMSQRIRSQGELSTRDLRPQKSTSREGLRRAQSCPGANYRPGKAGIRAFDGTPDPAAPPPEELPKPDGWELGAYWQPARAVSGDFYDFIPLSERYLAIVIADVTDKGVPAALVMAVTRSVIRAVTKAACASSGCVSPGSLLEQIKRGTLPGYADEHVRDLLAGCTGC